MRKLPTTGGTQTHDTLNYRKSALPAEQARVNYRGNSAGWPTIMYILTRDGEGTKKKARKAKHVRVRVHCTYTIKHNMTCHIPRQLHSNTCSANMKECTSEYVVNNNS